MLPALGLVALYLLFQIAVAFFRPQACPAIPPQPDAPKGAAMIRRLLEVLVAPVGLIVVVLGSILGGLATPTEAAAVGAFGAMLLTARKVDPAASGPAMIAAAAIAALLALRSLVDLRLGRTAGAALGPVAIAAAFVLLAAVAHGSFGAVVTIRRGKVLC